MKIRDTQTGDEAPVPTAYVEEMGAGFDWTEGNFSCDCNRALLLARSPGRSAPENPVCGEARYVLVDMPVGWVDRP